MNTAYSEVMMWNGQFGATGPNATTQSSWTSGTPKYNNYLGYQGLETTGLAAEARHRLAPDTAWLASVPEYKNLFDLAFPDLPDTARITNLSVSLALAAYQRTLLPNQSPFQLWLRGNNKAMNKDETDGKTLFFGKAKCATCHALPLLADNKLHSAEEMGIDSFEAMRSPTGKYRTTPLGGLFARTKGGFFHDGQFPTLMDVVNHYNTHFTLNLTTAEKGYLVEYLKSL